MQVKRWSWLSMAVLALGAGGCGGPPAPKPETLVNASGVITVDGKPAAGVQLMFYPTAETKGQGGNWALTDAEGKFSVTHWSGKSGLPAGSYQVTFSKFVKPDGSALGQNESPAMVKAKQQIDPAYSEVGNAGPHSRMDIPPEGKTDLKFDVKGAKK